MWVKAHVQVADRNAVLGLEEERVFAVQDRLLEGAFAKVMLRPGRCRRLLRF